MERIIRWILAAVGIALFLYASAMLIGSLDRKADMESRLAVLRQEAEDLRRENDRIAGELTTPGINAPAAEEIPETEPPL